MVVETPQQKWRKANLPHLREYERNRYATRPEIRKSKKNTYYKQKYGITIDERDAILLDQENKCAICAEEFSRSKDAHLDHCHETGKIRGILCNSCNNGLGRFRDSPEILNSAIKYLTYSGQP